MEPTTEPPLVPEEPGQQGRGITCGQTPTPKPRPRWHLPGHVPGTAASSPHSNSGRRACHSHCADEETKAQTYF